jgi:hypothetical protein
MHKLVSGDQARFVIGFGVTAIYIVGMWIYISLSQPERKKKYGL